MTRIPHWLPAAITFTGIALGGILFLTGIVS